MQISSKIAHKLKQMSAGTDRSSTENSHK